MLTKSEQELLERLGAEGKVTALKSDEIRAAKELDKVDLVFLVRDGTGGAVITPRAGVCWRSLSAHRSRSKRRSVFWADGKKAPRSRGKSHWRLRGLRFPLRPRPDVLFDPGLHFIKAEGLGEGTLDDLAAQFRDCKPAAGALD